MPPIGGAGQGAGGRRGKRASTATTTAGAAGTRQAGRRNNDNIDRDYGDPIIANGGVEHNVTVTDQLLNRIADGVLMQTNWTPRKLKKQIALCMGV